MIKSILFDFNGVIVNDEPLHSEVLQQTLADIDIHWNAKAAYRKYIGHTDRDTFRQILLERGIHLNELAIHELVAAKTVRYCSEIQKRDLFLPNILKFVKQKASHYKIGLVSGALRHEIQAWLQKGAILHNFSCIIASEDVQKGKPDPEGYLKALDAINRQHPAGNQTQPQECLAIEDSLSGIQAAHAAGMKCAAITSSFPKRCYRQPTG